MNAEKANGECATENKLLTTTGDVRYRLKESTNEFSKNKTQLLFYSCFLCMETIPGSGGVGEEAHRLTGPFAKGSTQLLGERRLLCSFRQAVHGTPVMELL